MEIEISMPVELFLEAALLAHRQDITIRELFCRAVSGYVKGGESGGQDSRIADDRVREDSSVADVWVKMQWESLPVDLHRKEPTENNPYPYCICGCGHEDKPGSKFKPGHDARLREAIKGVKGGDWSADALSNELIDVAMKDPKFEVHGYTAEEILSIAGDRAAREIRAVKRGEIWGVSLPDPCGSGTSDPRAVLVIQSNGFNVDQINTVMVAVVSSDLDLVGVPGNVFLNKEESSLATDSVVNVSQILTLDKALFKGWGRVLTPEIMGAVDGGLRLALGL